MTWGFLDTHCRIALWHHRYVNSSHLERLAQAAYEAHRSAHPGLPSQPWEDITEHDRTGLADCNVRRRRSELQDPLPRQRPSQSLQIQTGDQRHVFHADVHQSAARARSSSTTNSPLVTTPASESARGLWYVEDLGSTNGTWLNGRRIHTTQLLRRGDKIRVGHTVMTVISA